MTWNPDMKVRAEARLTIYGVTDADVDRIYQMLNAMSDNEHRNAHVSICETSRELDDGRVTP